MTSDTDYTYMQAALKEAFAAQELDEVPIGAVIVDDETGKIIARAGNRTRTMNDPTAHAEILAIRDACKVKGAQRIPGCKLFVTLEPCAMCAAAISFARLDAVILAAHDEKGGGILHGPKFFNQPTCHHSPKVHQGPLTKECGRILKEFFRKKRL